MKTVPEGFRTLLERIEPRSGERLKAKTHASGIKQALRSAFELKKFEEIGSHTRGTAISRYSDVDHLAMFSRNEMTWGDGLIRSDRALAKVREVLEGAYGRTKVVVDGPAVVVNFGQGEEAVDVVPAVWKSTVGIDGYPLYEIPDGMGRGGWMTTSPERHGKYISGCNDQSRGKLARTMWLLKHWRYSRTPNIPFLGFHVELLLAQEAVCVGVKGYAECLLKAFRLLRDRRGRALQDPVGISGLIPAAFTEAKRDALVNAAAYAAEHAARAVDAENRGDLDEAFRQWNIVFKDAFPSRRG